MNGGNQFARRLVRVVLIAAAAGAMGHAASVLAQEVKVTLSGNQEIPPVTTPANHCEP